MAAEGLTVGQLLIPETAGHVVVDQARRLHDCVDNGGSDETKATALEVGAQKAGLLGLSGNFKDRRPGIYEGLAIDEAPEISIEAAELVGNREQPSRVPDGGRDFGSISDDPGQLQQTLDVVTGHGGYLRRIESTKRLPQRFSLIQNNGPAETRLEAIQDEILEQLGVIVEWNPPFTVVILGHEIRRFGPFTAGYGQ